ncbi:MAG: phosphoribosylanthranilate isomerase [Flavobacteriales bacterium]
MANISAVATLQPDWMGFIFYMPSPRFVGDNFITPTLEGISKVGVFVNVPEEEVLKKRLTNHLDMIQLHGRESSTYCQSLVQKGLTLIKVFGIDERFSFEQAKEYESTCRYFIFDTKTPAHGGSGKKFSWKKLSEYKLKIPFLLSGGIGPEDIDLINTCSHPQLFGIDLNSRFEISPGAKDITTLRTFIEKIRS